MDLMTEAEAKKVIRHFGAWLKKECISQATASRLTGYSASVISSVLRGVYTADVAPAALAMANVLARHRDRTKSPQRPTFARTNAARQVVGALSDAHANCWQVMILGERGVGKTWAVREYASRTKGCLSVRCMPHCTNRSLVNQLARQIGVDFTGRNRNITDIARDCADEMANTQQLLVVHEVDFMTETFGQTLRAIVDMTDLTGGDDPTIGVAYIGTPAFLRGIERWSKETADQFLDRVEQVVQLNPPTKGDVKMLLSDYRLAEGAVDVAHAGCDGSLRRLASAAVLATKLAAGGIPRPEHFEDAYAQLLKPIKSRIRA